MSDITREIWDAAFDGDGQRWKTLGGESMEDYCERHGLWVETLSDPYLPDGRSILLADGECVITTEGGWDYLHPDCACGCCWEGGELECEEDSDE